MSFAAHRPFTALSRVLAPLGHVQPAGSGLELAVNDARFRFDVRWAGEGFPDDVRRVLAALPEPVARHGSPPAITVIAARRLSTGARRLLREHHLNWVDESGAAWIVAAPGLLVDRAGQSPEPRRPSTSWGWSAGSACLAEVVLTAAAQEARRRGAQGLATGVHTLPTASLLTERAGVSVSMVNTTVRAWAAQGWVEKRGGQRGPTSTRLLVAPAELLSSWATWTASTPAAELAIDADFADAITWVRTELPTVMPRQGTWCLGGAAAAALLAPGRAAVSQVLCHVESHVFDLLRDSLERGGAALVTADEVHRLLLRAAPSATVRLADTGPVPVASAPRVYADLVAAGGADGEGATHFRKVALGF